MGETWEGGDNYYEIYVMNADGSGLRRLTDTPGSEGHPAWSPDGTMIAFNSERNNLGERGLGARIYVMNADGAGQRQLTEIYGEYPDSSPDGRRIVFSGDRLYIVNVDGSKLTPLAIPGARFRCFPTGRSEGSHDLVTP
jgi:Tol biopolymer transport system component